MSDDVTVIPPVVVVVTVLGDERMRMNAVAWKRASLHSGMKMSGRSIEKERRGLDEKERDLAKDLTKGKEHRRKGKDKKKRENNGKGGKRGKGERKEKNKG